MAAPSKTRSPVEAASGWSCLLAVGILLLSSCATSYEEANWYRGGYSDVRIDANTESVSFSGNSSTSRQTVEIYLLYRCAEITRQSGYDYFVIVDRSTQATQNVSPGQYTATTVQTFPGRRHGYGQAVTTGTYLPGVVYTEYGAQALIKMFKGPKPESNPNAYNADDVLQHLGPQVSGGSQVGGD
jgi:archaellin